MEYRFKRDLKNSFMIIDSGFDKMGYEKDVLRNNDIDVLVPFHTVDINNVTQVWYDITGLVSLKDYLSRQGIDLKLIRKILLYFKIAISEVERYLIDINHLLLDVDTVYVVKDKNEWKLMFIYYPNGDTEASLKSVMEFFMNNCDKELMDTCFKLYDAAEDGTNIDGLIKIIDEEDKESFDEPVIGRTEEVSYEEENINKSEDIFPEERSTEEEIAFNEILEMGDPDAFSITDKIKKYFANYFDNKKEKSVDRIEKPYGKDNKNKKGGIFSKSFTLFGNNNKRDRQKTEDLEDFIFEPDQELYEPTVLLKSIDEDNVGASYVLQYMGNNKNDNIRINKDELLLGSAREGNDSIIDSPVISRFHAKIIREGSDIFLQDLNSTNGTSVNGKLIGYSDKVLLSRNDEIMFADERYRVV